MRAPFKFSAFSDASLLEWEDSSQTIARLKYLPVIVDNFANLNNWTVVDSGSNISLSSGVVSINGNGASYVANGLKFTGGITRAAGYIEFKVKISASLANDICAWISATDVIGTYTSLVCPFISGASLTGYFLSSIVTAQPLNLDAFHTIRIYIGLSKDGTSWRAVKITILGGAFTTETILVEMDKYQSATVIPTPFYVGFSRYANNAGNPAQIKEFRWNSGYSSAGPYARWVVDAGAGKTLDTVNLASVAMPGTVASTNLRFAYSFTDSASPTMSAFLTLAQLQAVGTLAGRYRYLWLDVQHISDGATQVYSATPNADDITAGAGDFPEVGNVWSGDTVQLSAGTEDLPALSSVSLSDTLRGEAGTSDKIYSATDEAARNTPVLTKYQKNETYLHLNVLTTGTYDPSNPYVTGLTEVALSSAGGQLVTIQGINFGAIAGTCDLGTIISWADTEIVLRTTARTAGNFDFTVTTNAATTATATVEFANPPLAPEEFTASPLSTDRVGLEWGFAKGSTGTYIYRSKNQSTGYELVESNIQDNFFDDEDLDEDTYYYYKLRSFSDILGIFSDYTDPIGVRTQASVSPPAPDPGEFARPDTALSFSEITGLEKDLSLAGDFTFMFWLKGVDTHCDVFNAFGISIHNGALVLRQGSQEISQRLNWSSGWASLFVRRSRDEIAIGKNGVILNTFLVSDTPSYNGTLEIMRNEVGELFDLRVYNNAISDEAYAYYYRDVTQNNGDALLPIWL